MEIRTCEEYVLAKLARLEEEYDEAVDELAEARREVARLEETITWQLRERERTENELKDANECIRSLEATCSEFARENDRLKKKVRDGE